MAQIKRKIAHNRLTLHEAMKIVLIENNNHGVTAKELSDEIFRRRLYLKRDGTKAKPSQISARLCHHTDIFNLSDDHKISLA